MTPQEWAERLRATQVQAQQVPMRVEQAVAAEALRDVPRGVSVAVQRTELRVQGSGARAHAGRVRRRVAPRVAELVRQVMRP